MAEKGEAPQERLTEELLERLLAAQSPEAYLDQVVTLSPDYAEGWNRRATLHYAMENYAKSMADIGRTLDLEPRHFGALGGMAAILRDAGRKEAAMRAYERLLEVYPMMRNAQTELGKLADEMAGQGI